MTMHNTPEWQRWRRARFAARCSVYGIVWSLIGTLAITQTAEVVFGFPHYPGIAYAVSGGFAVWAVFAIRIFSKLARPDRPTLAC